MEDGYFLFVDILFGAIVFKKKLFNLIFFYYGENLGGKGKYWGKRWKPCQIQIGNLKALIQQ